MQIPTVTLYRGDAHLICNEDDQARFVAQGWQRQPAPAAPEPELPAHEPAAPTKRTKK